MKDCIAIRNNLINKIDKAIEDKAMGTESVEVKLIISEDEKEIFYDIEKYNNEHYFWFIGGNELYISYTEDI